ncbi:restriction endonuclease [Clostridium sporogenes]|uniref:PmeII family type II restriction endonuclease n=1 Tax=Clostridium sporogenes TaxID=1509 RepID=UPI0013D132D9|nr:PmeII family type II restriction endonuclease [Clostridium sporogenes]NFM16725.1 restriction endonuclease [Clostridium sporogenes]
MTENEKQEILEKAKEFFKDIIVESHIKNTKKLIKLKEFNVNPFLITYLANYLTGNNSAESIAKALIYPRVLGTSINTLFGNKLQTFCSKVLNGFASTTSGIDIEFIDAVDNRRKYCQIKAGPNTINKDDVETIKNHFKAVRTLARTNGLSIQFDDLVLGVLYGTEKELNGNYKKINEDYPVIVGQDFWYHITGDENFYSDLINAFGEVAIEADSTKLLNNTIISLANEIRNSDEFKNLLK